MKWRHELGSDVPFFLHGGTALAVRAGDGALSVCRISREEPILVVSSRASRGHRTGLSGAGREV